MEIVDIYKQVISNAGMISDKDGFVSMKLGDTESSPVTIKGKRLVLPTTEQLRNGDLSNRVIFHPLYESITRGESDVIVAFRERLVRRLNFIVSYIGTTLLTLAASNAEHASNSSPEKLEFLTLVPDANEQVLKRFKKICDVVLGGVDESSSFVRITIRRNRALSGGKTSRRSAVVDFPFYEELKKIGDQNGSVFEVTIKKSERKAFMAVMEYLFTKINTPNEYSYDSISNIAPTLESMMWALANLGDNLNRVITVFKDRFDDYESILINDDWGAAFKNLDSLQTKINLIPMQIGNEGALPVSSSDKLKQVAVPEVVTKVAPPTVSTQFASASTPVVTEKAPSIVNQAPVAPAAPATSGEVASNAPRSLTGVGIKYDKTGKETTGPGIDQQRVQAIMNAQHQSQVNPGMHAPMIPQGFTFVNGQVVAAQMVPNIPMGYGLVNNQLAPLQQIEQMLAVQQAQQMQQMQQMQPVQQMQWQQVPVMQQQIPSQLPGIVKTANGVDFQSYLQNNPMLAAQVNQVSQAQMMAQYGAIPGMVPGMMPGMMPMVQMVQQRETPRWAANNYQINGGYGRGY